MKRTSEATPDASSYLFFLELMESFHTANNHIELISARTHLLLFMAEYGTRENACTYFSQHIYKKIYALMDQQLNLGLLSHPVLSNYLSITELTRLGSSPNNHKIRLRIVKCDEYIRRINIEKLVKWAIQFNEEPLALELMSNPTITAKLTKYQCLKLLDYFPHYNDLLKESLLQAHETLPPYRKAYWLKSCVHYLIQESLFFKKSLESDPVFLVHAIMAGAHEAKFLLWFCKEMSLLNTAHIKYLWENEKEYRCILYELPHFSDYRCPIEALAKDETMTSKALLKLAKNLFQQKPINMPLIKHSIHLCMLRISSNSCLIQKEVYSAMVVVLTEQKKYDLAFSWASRAQYLYNEEEWQLYIHEILKIIVPPTEKEKFRALLNNSAAQPDDEMILIQRLRALNLNDKCMDRMEEYHHEKQKQNYDNNILPKFVRIQSFPDLVEIKKQIALEEEQQQGFYFEIGQNRY